MFRTLLLSLLALTQSSVAEEREIAVTFRNEFPSDALELFWVSPSDGNRVAQGSIASRGGEKKIYSRPGHEFYYADPDGKDHYVRVPTDQGDDAFIILSGTRQEIRVRCATTASGGKEQSQVLDILVKPYWSTRGASRFLDLVRAGYYDGVALNRVVPNFLTQFGIAADYDTRTAWRQRTIKDDQSASKIPFRPGMMSFAGSGEDSRTTEVFIVMPGTSIRQLEYFGTNAWETPFAVVDGDVANTPVSRWHSYGDMPPWGSGPESSLIYKRNGYDYLKESFPSMDYIERCVILEESELADEL